MAGPAPAAAPSPAAAPPAAAPQGPQGPAASPPQFQPPQPEKTDPAQPQAGPPAAPLPTQGALDRGVLDSAPGVGGPSPLRTGQVTAAGPATPLSVTPQGLTGGPLGTQGQDQPGGGLPFNPGSGVFGAGQGFTTAGNREIARGTQGLIDNPILVKQWVSSTSPWNGKGGFSTGAQNYLQARGINFAPQAMPVAPGSVGWGSGYAPNVANNINGAAAENRLASMYRNAGFNVQQQVPEAGRRVDVRVDMPNAQNPTQGGQLDIESKAKRVVNDAEFRGQANADAAALERNRAVRGAAEDVIEHGGALKGVGKVLKPVGLIMDGAELYSSFEKDGGKIGDNTGRTASGIAGGLAGAAAGAAIGSIVPGVGTVIGGVVGGIIGGVGGDMGGRALYDTIKGWF